MELAITADLSVLFFSLLSLESKGHIWPACKHPHFKVPFLFRVAGQSRNNISFKLWQSLFKKRRKEKKGGSGGGGQFHDLSLQNDMLLSLPHPPLVCQYIYPSFLLPSFFAFGRKRQETWNISPSFFSSLTRLVKTSWREKVCHFLQPPTNKI